MCDSTLLARLPGCEIQGQEGRACFLLPAQAWEGLIREGLGYMLIGQGLPNYVTT